MLEIEVEHFWLYWVWGVTLVQPMPIEELSMIDHLVLTGQDQLLLVLKKNIFY